MPGVSGIVMAVALDERFTGQWVLDIPGPLHVDGKPIARMERLMAP